MSRPKLRIFVPVTTLPRPDHNAGARQFCEMLALLAKRHRVELWSAGEDRLEPADIERYRAGLTESGVVVLPTGWSAYVWALTSSHYHLGLFQFYTNAERFAEDFKRRQPGAAVVVDTGDVQYAREEAGVALGVIDAAQAAETKRRELAAYRHADAVLVVSEDESALLSKESGVGRHFVVPLMAHPRPRTKQLRAREVLFVGGFAHKPNADGITWFVREAWPHVIAAMPDAKLTIVGSNVPREVATLADVPGVVVEGYVSSVEPFLQRASAVIAPLRYGGGVKGKVVDAMAAGVPVITTSVGIQGLPVRRGIDLLVSDDAEGLAWSTVFLFANPDHAASMGLEGQRAVAFCAPDAVAHQLERVVRTVAQPGSLRSRAAWIASAIVHAAGVLRRRVSRRAEPANLAQG